MVEMKSSGEQNMNRWEPYEPFDIAFVLFLLEMKFYYERCYRKYSKDFQMGKTDLYDA